MAKIEEFIESILGGKSEPAKESGVEGMFKNVGAKYAPKGTGEPWKVYVKQSDGTFKEEDPGERSNWKNFRGGETPKGNEESILFKSMARGMRGLTIHPGTDFIYGKGEDGKYYMYDGKNRSGAFVQLQGDKPTAKDIEFMNTTLTQGDQSIKTWDPHLWGRDYFVPEFKIPGGGAKNDFFPGLTAVSFDEKGIPRIGDYVMEKKVEVVPATQSNVGR
jgi:hypothetical protein